MKGNNRKDYLFGLKQEYESYLFFQRKIEDCDKAIEQFLFTSWLRLAPNNKISGGRVLSNRIPKGSNRLKIALRNAANAIGNLKDTHLSDFFRRVAFRKGRQAAVSATAKKLAVILWNMLVKKTPYYPPTDYLFLDQKRKLKLVNRIRKTIAKLNLKPEEIALMTR